MMQKATLFGGSVVVGPHDLNDQYHFTTRVCYFLKLKRMKMLWLMDSPEDRKGKIYLNLLNQKQSRDLFEIIPHLQRIMKLLTVVNFSSFMLAI